MNKNVKSLTIGSLMAVFAAVGANDNALNAQSPGGFTPKAHVRTEVLVAPADSVTTGSNDTLAIDFKKKTVAEDSTKKREITEDMTLDNKAMFYSINNPAIGIVIYKGKDMAKYTEEQMAAKFEKFCTDRGVQGKVFIADISTRTGNSNGNSVYMVFVNGSVVGGLMNNDTILSKDGLPEATMIQKGFDNRDRRASLTPSGQ